MGDGSRNWATPACVLFHRAHLRFLHQKRGRFRSDLYSRAAVIAVGTGERTPVRFLADYFLLSITSNPSQGTTKGHENEVLVAISRKPVLAMDVRWGAAFAVFIPHSAICQYGDGIWNKWPAI